MPVNNSTNVRTVMLRLGLAALQRLSPWLAARSAAPLFLRTPARRSSVRRAAMSPGAGFDVRSRDAVLRVWSYGAGPTVLLIHGWGGRARQLASFLEPLRRKGYRVLMFDAPGHGASSGTELSLPAFADAIRAVAAGPVHAIVAHSLGAAASAVAIADGLEVERAVFVGPPSDELRWFERFGELLQLSAETKRLTRQVIEERVGAPFSRFTAESLGPELQLPLLVVHDRLDREVPWDDGARIASAAPAATLLSSEGLGHRKILRDPAVVERIVEFVGGAAPSAEPLRVGCRRCGASLDETWHAASELCMSCELQLELWEPSRRWSPRAA